MLTLPRSLIFVVLLCGYFQTKIGAETFRVADRNGGFVLFEEAILNKSGTVLFSARRGSQFGNIGVYKGSAGGVQTIAEGPLTNPSPGDIPPAGAEFIEISDAGRVALIANAGQGPAVFVSSGRIRPQNAVASYVGSGSVSLSGSYVAAGSLVMSLTDERLARCDACVEGFFNGPLISGFRRPAI